MLVADIARPAPPGWKVGHVQHLSGNGYVRELLPADETIDDWRHLATVQFFDGADGTAQDVLRRVERATRALCEVGEWLVLEPSPHDVTYEWWGREGSGGEPRHEVARLLQGPDGIHRIAYAERGVSMDPVNREHWLQVLRGARLVSGEAVGEAGGAAADGAPTELAEAPHGGTPVAPGTPRRVRP